MNKIRPSRIIKGTVKTIIGKKTKISTERLKICKQCDKLNKGICTVCGCIVKSKTKVIEEYCPMNKWNESKVLKKVGIAITIKNPEIAKFTIDEEDNAFIFHYGTIKKAADTKLNLVITNDRGNHFNENQDLTKLRSWSPCSCTIGSKTPEELKEGNSFDFEVTYDSKRLLGVFSKKIEFSSKEILFKILLKGEVIE